MPLCGGFGFRKLGGPGLGRRDDRRSGDFRLGVRNGLALPTTPGSRWLSDPPGPDVMPHGVIAAAVAQDADLGEQGDGVGGEPCRRNGYTGPRAGCRAGASVGV